MHLHLGKHKTYLLLAFVALAALLATGCATQAGAQDGGKDGSASRTYTWQPPAYPGSYLGPYDGPTGIWVTGAGKASGAPDIALISLGVESIEETASTARANAAAAMQSVQDALTEADIPPEDIQTRRFNISPRYQSVEVQRCDDPDSSASEEAASEGPSEGEEQAVSRPAPSSVPTCYKVWESRLIGYAVSNQASVKIRDLDNVGDIIDQVAEAAGDLVRINGISFNIEDPEPLRDEARANAVADLERRAAMLADLSGVTLGPLVYLNEGSSYVPPQPLYARAEAAFASSDAFSTSISPGELDVSVTVQGVYLIAGEAVEPPTEGEDTGGESEQQGSQ